MIERYCLKEMSSIFNDKCKFNTYLKVELLASEAFANLGLVPQEDLQAMKQNAKVNLKRIAELEEITHHDVVAFTRQIDETLGQEKKWLHYGLTSTDIVDTSLCYQYKKADIIIEKKLNLLLEALKAKALEYQNTPCIGRTHGMQAEVTSFGLKWALYYDELSRDIARFKKVRKEIEVCKISGSVGNFANVPSYVQDYVAKKLSLGSVNISTQVLSRDRHCYYACTLATLSTLFEKIATEIRNLSRSEIHEVEESFSKGQKGSSSMPQKRNPISSENIVGLSRLIRGYLTSIMEDNALYHERDISHSSVERVAFIDMIELLDYQLTRCIKLVSNLVCFPQKMLDNISLSNESFFAQRIMSNLIVKGLTREKAYDLIQPLAMKAALGNEKLSVLIKNNEELSSYFNQEEMKELFDISYYLKSVDEIYRRVGILSC